LQLARLLAPNALSGLPEVQSFLLAGASPIVSSLDITSDILILNSNLNVFTHIVP